MVEHGSTGTHSHGFEEHAKTYDGFIKGSIAGTIFCLYVMVALVAFAFIAAGTNLLVGFGGLIIGTLALIIDLRVGGSWKLSVGWLVIYGLLTTVMLA
jgi:hypothetical protein